MRKESENDSAEEPGRSKFKPARGSLCSVSVSGTLGKNVAEAAWLDAVVTVAMVTVVLCESVKLQILVP